MAEPVASVLSSLQGFPELVIFDSDGVLVDSEKISLQVLSDKLTRMGVSYSYDDCVREFLGVGEAATWAKIAKISGNPVSDRWIQKLNSEVYDRFRSELRPMPGICEVLERLTTNYCVASSGSHEKLALTLSLTGLYAYFKGRIFSAQDVQRGKPAPDLFLLAASKMGVSSRAAVVVEDSPAGIAAANAAGMQSIGFAHTTPAERLGSASRLIHDMDSLLEALQEANRHRV